MRGMRRLAALLAAILFVLPLQAYAHDPAAIRVAEPRAGATVSGDKVRIVVVGEGGSAAAAFRIDLDGRPVDATGTIDGVFTTLTVQPGGQVTVEVPVADGEHELRVTPERNPDGPSQPAQVVAFQAGGGGNGGVLGLVALVAVLAVLGAAGLRSMRRARPGDVADPG